LCGFCLDLAPVSYVPLDRSQRAIDESEHPGGCQDEGET
jgi:hypothetical protein